MKELLRTTDVVLISALKAALAEAGIRLVELDTHTSVMEGSIGALPRRMMVAAADHAVAARILDDLMAGDHG
ncbi:DUF2007 domain-containing protein [Roseospirillum parvum]|uniref:Putative signal transducing protein n=1 Tax=Roseospirillum parvum TaxID=83401 RepID=A0A1G8AYQ1_9PROT|nr:DUF2007 domain-containing protein [Roseospirillum parvum]SDH26047.1 Putative signal transducing protein [Roseospirillum parvum]